MARLPADNCCSAVKITDLMPILAKLKAKVMPMGPAPTMVTVSATARVASWLAKYGYTWYGKYNEARAWMSGWCIFLSNSNRVLRCRFIWLQRRSGRLCAVLLVLLLGLFGGKADWL